MLLFDVEMWTCDGFFRHGKRLFIGEADMTRFV